MKQKTKKRVSFPDSSWAYARGMVGSSRSFHNTYHIAVNPDSCSTPRCCPRGPKKSAKLGSPCAAGVRAPGAETSVPRLFNGCLDGGILTDFEPTFEAAGSPAQPQVG